MTTHQSPSWFLAINTTLNDVMANTALRDPNDEQVNEQLDAFDTLMKSFFIAIDESRLQPLTGQKQQERLEYFAKIYPSILNGLTELYLACLDPQQAKGMFDYGAEYDARVKQQKQVDELCLFVDSYYTELIRQNPTLPIPFPSPNYHQVDVFNEFPFEPAEAS